MAPDTHRDFKNRLYGPAKPDEMKQILSFNRETAQIKAHA